MHELRFQRFYSLGIWMAMFNGCVRAFVKRFSFDNKREKEIENEKTLKWPENWISNWNNAQSQ